MEQKDKDLLLKDLCARLPYGVKCDVGDNKPYTLSRMEIDDNNGHLLDFIEMKNGFIMEVYLSEVKPYLFPLSSMTKEQIKYIRDRFCYEWEGEPYELWKHQIDIEDAEELIDWFIENHIDYRGLIPMGLANDATGLNIY